MSVLLVLLVSFAAIGSPPAPAAGADVASLLAGMSSAMRELDYQGSFVYQRGGQTDAMRIFHAGGDDERERVVGLTGQRNEIVRDGDMITCLQQEAAAVALQGNRGRRLLPLVPEVDMARIHETYSVHLAGQDRVAGYAADVIDIRPRDQLRYGYRLWLHRDNQLLLRSQLLDAGHHQVEQFMFVALQIGTPPTAMDLLPSTRNGMAITLTAAPAGGVPSRWQADALPAGFELVSSRQVVAGINAEHLLYSDGLADLSIYIEPLDAGADRDSTWARGGLHVVSRATTDGAGARWLVTALGNLPEATLRSVAESLRPRAVQTLSTH